MASATWAFVFHTSMSFVGMGVLLAGPPDVAALAAAATAMGYAGMLDHRRRRQDLDAHDGSGGA